MGRVSLKALIVACLVMFVLDLSTGFGLLTWGMIGRVHEGMSEEALTAVMLEISMSNKYLTWSMATGTATTILGGYLVARIAKSARYLNALIFGMIGMVIGYFLSEDLPVWFIISAQLTTIPAALFGAYLYRGTNA